MEPWMAVGIAGAVLVVAVIAYILSPRMPARSAPVRVTVASPHFWQGAIVALGLSTLLWTASEWANGSGVYWRFPLVLLLLGCTFALLRTTRRQAQVTS